MPGKKMNPNMMKPAYQANHPNMMKGPYTMRPSILNQMSHNK